ncbi:RpiB/LacA/LacB family sugar-phosphate isomerase [Trueperella pyogenes]|uniref:RpiB/LacA/LacB family sugar-phosphate isomerase n=1 Tax=Trueperella pyogenes TaxID=1661 RepID=A0A3S9QN39_9ACTO|nr:RpiB/LacA/LacB family sugar-phosphate isomerase [Trueperella pyogenes]AJC70132.1 sugar phosphate isomerase [Trueperella pyogenes TP8]ALD73227.1 sugar phosphate isomerase [Trueperella pyogenes]AWG03365.1 RpiB/LacA/LacB family sugar-phosphate isomerase [Trueperella pyogenes]AWG16096.1 RpiB/LacA/LacB family sugar-phosphate isomerase [Trueperella pyogenes]AZR04979.1 RpiB/LacA/LacB family sugar-phosphate isomerase [Trueperella pyogenes]
MKLAFGCDPNATALKHDLMKKAAELGHEVADLGSDDPIYANVAFDVATAVAKGEYDRGVLVCGTGIGVSIAANKVEGAYCACIHDVYQAERAVLSNNANLIAMGSQVIGNKLAEKLLEEYLKYDYDPNSRSRDKVNRICEFERGE